MTEPMIVFHLRIPVELDKALRARAKMLNLRPADVARIGLAKEVQLGQISEALTQLKRITQRAREELERAKPGSAVWEALRFILSSPIEHAQEEPTWEPLDHGYVDCPGQPCGALDD